MLASPAFQAMCFLEGSILRAERKIEIPLLDDDQISFVVVIYIMYRNQEKFLVR